MTSQISATDSRLLQIATDTFYENGEKSIFFTNRSRSNFLAKRYHNAPCSMKLHIDAELRKQCLENVNAKIEGVANYFFFTKNGERCNLSLDVIQKWENSIEKEVSCLISNKDFAYVDLATNIELAPIRILPQGCSSEEKLVLRLNCICYTTY